MLRVGELTRIAIKTKGLILFVNPEEVVCIRARGSYVLLQGESATHLLREPISVMAEKMVPFGFVRIHRSTLINRCFVQEVRPLVTGEYGLRLKNGKELIVTRTYKKNLKALAELWVGGASFLTS